MGCANCGSDTPNGCKNNGACGSGGCNKLEVFDWLANVSLPSGQAPYDILEVRFKNSRKGFFRNTKNIALQAGDVVLVEGSPGVDVGVVSVVGELARVQVRKKAPGFKPVEAKKIKQIADQEHIDNWIKARSLEKEVMYKARTLAVNLSLQMKISDVEYQADLTKATFYYTAEGRVDFRQLIKDMADQFKIRIEMRQIGARQEASRLGGIGSCGRELCCSTWLTDFRSVSTSAARYQQLSLNPQKLAGQCGKLKCCLNYELDMYLDAIKAFPKGDLRLKTERGSAIHIKTDVFRRQMWYLYEGETGAGNAMVPLDPDRVREVLRMNKDGKKPADLREYMEEVEIDEPDYTNVVGQDSLNRFDKAFKKKKKRPNKKKGGPQGKGSNQGNQQKGGQPNKQNQQNQPAAQKQGEGQGQNKTGGQNKNKRRNNRNNKPNNKSNETKT
ncbi:MAG: regulatory iron-sulfur-containing complex subunit RicT [Crocinitomicaceae bacterium]|nr:regulatory iron-sulfur-containing complex subunit RicT [Crocinitomicaceae bacterium]